MVHQSVFCSGNENGFRNASRAFLENTNVNAVPSIQRDVDTVVTGEEPSGRCSLNVKKVNGERATAFRIPDLNGSFFISTDGADHSSGLMCISGQP